MNYTIFIIAAYLMGAMAAVPAGPVQIEVVRRSINGHLKTSLIVILGAFLVDVFYGLIAFFGVAPFLEDESVMALFWLFGGLILTVLGIIIIRQTLKKGEPDYNEAHLKKKRWAFLGGLSLSATNPVMILWWLSGAKIFRDVGLIKDFTPRVAISFLAAGSLGLASYLAVLSLFIYWAKKFISPKRIRQINLVFGILLLLIAFYFIFTSLISLFNIG